MATVGDGSYGWFSRIIVAVVLLISLIYIRLKDSGNNGTGPMPQMSHFEDKAQCLNENPENIYCVAMTVVKPDNDSTVWKMIDKHSREDTDFQRNVLDRGFCMKSCESIVASLTEEERSFYDHEKVPVDVPYIFDSRFITGMEQYKRTYGRLVNICLNYQLHRDYNLSGYSEIEHCTQKLDKPLTAAHILFAGICIIACCLVIRATLYDNKTIRNLNNNQVKIEVSSSEPENDIWMEFSLKRSIRRLTAKPHTKLQRDFDFIESIRVLSVIMITLVHTAMAFVASPTSNPGAIETIFGDPFVRMVSSVFPFLVHTFFTIGGMLLAVHFKEFTETTPKFRWRFLFSGILNRYLRMLPVYFMMWLYQISWYDRLGNGPVSYRFIDIEAHFCRKNGWSNFLFAHNYYKYNEACMQQTWYMAADFQFFCIGMVIMMLLWKYPKATKALIAGMMTISIVVPIINNYIYNFVGVILVNFKHLRFLLYQYKWVQLDYVLAHPHTCSYFSGIIAGILYHRARKDPQYLENLVIYKYLKRVAPLMVLLLAAPATLFYGIKPSEPSLWMAIYASAHRNFFGIMCGVGLLHGATEGGKNMPAFLKHPLMLALGRLSFCVYITQFNAIRTFFVNAQDYGFTLTFPKFFDACFLAFGYSYAFGLLLCTTIELPIAAIVKRLQGTSNSSKKTNLSQETNTNGKIKTS